MPRSRAWYKSEQKQTTKRNEIVPVQAPEQKPNLIGSVVQGFGFGVGSSIAHNVVGSVVKTMTSNDQSPTKKGKPECEEYRRVFDACLEDRSCSNETARNMWMDVKKYCEKETL